MLKPVWVVPTTSYVILVVVWQLELLFDVYGLLIKLLRKIHIDLRLIPSLVESTSWIRVGVSERLSNPLSTIETIPLVCSSGTPVPRRVIDKHIDISSSDLWAAIRLQKLLQVHYLIPILIDPLFYLLIVRIVRVLLCVELLRKVLCRICMIIQGIIWHLRGPRIHDLWGRVVMDILLFFVLLRRLYWDMSHLSEKFVCYWAFRLIQLVIDGCCWYIYIDLVIIEMWQGDWLIKASTSFWWVRFDYSRYVVSIILVISYDSVNLRVQGGTLSSAMTRLHPVISGNNWMVYIAKLGFKVLILKLQPHHLPFELCLLYRGLQ